MKNENRNEEAVSPVIATILMVAITVVLAGVLYVWASSLAEGNTDGNLALYAFSGEDAQGQPSVGTDDNLIMLTMDQGGDINWASVSVKLSIDGGSPVFCDNPGGEGGVCVLVDNGRDTNDQFWSVGDTVTIVETGTDLCSDSCTVDVTITDTREEKVIDTTNGVAAE
jgi:flagellin-like protein